MLRKVYVVVASMALLPAMVAATQTIDRRTALKTSLQHFNSAITLDVKQFGGDFTTWTRDWSEADPQVVTFRWSTGLKNAGSARWEVQTGSTMAVIANGSAGPVPVAGATAQFSIDFRSIAGVNKTRPLVYWVRLAVGSSLRSADGPIPPQLSGPVKVSFVGSGPVTTFTMAGLRPELLHTMPIAIDLQTLKGEGGDGFEPFLLPVVVYADGTTVKPIVNFAAKRVEFTSSGVRIAAAPGTHGNLLGDSSMDSGETISVPPETGHFETFLRPIGVDLMRDFKMTSAHQAALRSATMVGLLVVGLEEGSAPSTDVMNDLRDELVASLQTELDAIVRSTTFGINDLTDVPNIVQASRDVGARISARLKESAKARTMNEIWSYLKIPGGPVISGFLGLAALSNPDEFVGVGIRNFTYQQLIDAGEAGITFDLNLSSSESDLRYVVRGRARVR